MSNPLRTLPLLLAGLLLNACAEPQLQPRQQQPAPFYAPAPLFAPAALPPPPAATLLAPPPAASLPEVAPVALPLPPSFCGACRVISAHSHLQSPSIDEASGLAASALHPGVLYTHNDSGDLPRFFALDLAGRDLGSYLVAGALALDWEDMARGPCAGGSGSCLYFGDIGDNLRIRPTGSVYRVAEPAQVGPGEHGAQAEAFPFRYPDGSHDAETLLVHPLTGVITVVSKVRSGASGIYELPLPLQVNHVVMLRKVGEVQAPEGSPRFTAGDVHPRAEGVLLRTYDRLWFYAMRPEQSVAQALASAPCSVPVSRDSQGEAVAWEADGQGYVTTSEGQGAPLDEVRCANGR
jgi:hypothetical protein